MLLFVLPDQIYSSPLHFTIAQAQGTVIRVHFKALHSSLTNLGGNLSDQLSTQGHGQGQRTSKPAD